MLTQSQIDWIQTQPYFVLVTNDGGAVLCEERIVHEPSGREVKNFVQIRTWEDFSRWAGLGS